MHSVFIISHTAEQLQRSGELKYADTSFLNGYVFASVSLSLSMQQLRQYLLKSLTEYVRIQRRTACKQRNTIEDID